MSLKIWIPKISPRRASGLKYLLAAILIIALGVRIAYLMEVRFSPRFYELPRGMDEYNYDRLAYDLSRGEWSSDRIIYSLPLYPVFLAFIYTVWGRSLLAVRIAQLLLGTASCGLLYLLGEQTLGRGRGLFAALIMALYGMAVFHELLIIPTALAVFASLLALVWWSKSMDEDSARRWFIGGLLLGIASLASAANLLFGIILICFWQSRKGKKRKIPILPKRAASALGMLLVIAPFTLRNSRAGGGFLFLSAHAGINFYLGNNPESNGGFRTPPFLTPSASGIIRDSARRAEAISGKNLNPGQISRFWFRKGLGYLIRRPLKWVKLWLKKILLFIDPREYCDVGSGWFAESQGIRIGRIPLLKFAWLAPWILAGCFISYRQGRGSLLLYIFSGAQLAGVMLFFHQARARLVFIPVGALWAAESLFFFRKILIEKKIRKAAAFLLLLALYYVVFFSLPRQQMRSESNLLITAAQQELSGKNHEAARGKVEAALRINPELGGAYLILGEISFSAGDTKKAEVYYRRSKLNQPGDVGPYLGLARLFLKREDLEGAAAQLNAARSLDPLCGQAHSLAARIHFNRGENEKEIAEYRKALSLNPNSTEVLNNLAAAYARGGDLASAIPLWRRALQVAPDSERFKASLGKARRSLRSRTVSGPGQKKEWR